LLIAHVGDSRCYLFSNGRLYQLTRDHTVAAELARRGVVRRDEVARHPYRHVVTNVIGGRQQGVEVEMHKLDLEPGDAVLLCSDGLTESLPDEGIEAILAKESDPRQACERLVAEANARGHNASFVRGQFRAAQV
jgi:protein phosphatase